jgi:hypothetical protein
MHGRQQPLFQHFDKVRFEVAKLDAHAGVGLGVHDETAGLEKITLHKNLYEHGTAQIGRAAHLQITPVWADFGRPGRKLWGRSFPGHFRWCIEWESESAPAL